MKANGQVFVSGQIPADKSGNLIEGSVADKTELCCQNVIAVLNAAGSSIEKVVKVNVSTCPFLLQVNGYRGMKKMYNVE